jgi:hypothetical protein
VLVRERALCSIENIVKSLFLQNVNILIKNGAKKINEHNPITKKRLGVNPRGI